MIDWDPLPWDSLRPVLAAVHLLLFVGWLAAEAAGFLAVRQADAGGRLPAPPVRGRSAAVARALMVPSSLFLLEATGRWDAPDWLLSASLLVAASLALLAWHDTPHGRGRTVEAMLLIGLAGFWLTLGGVSLWQGQPLADHVAWKAVQFGLLLLLAPLRRTEVRIAAACVLLAATAWLGSGFTTVG